MPTETVQIVDPDGTGDFTSLADAVAQDLDLTALDDVRILRCISSGGTADALGAGIIDTSNWTTDATRYLVIEGGTAGHRGYWQTGAYILSHTIGPAIRIGSTATVVRGLQITGAGSGGSGNTAILVKAGITGCTIERNLIRSTYTGTGATAASVGIDLSATTGTNHVGANVLYDFVCTGATGKGIDVGASSTARVSRNTIHNCDEGVSGTAVAVLQQNVTQDCPDGYNTPNVTGSLNCSDVVSDAPGTSPITGTVTFADKANDDFHLSPNDTVATGAGADLSADAYALTTDIDYRADLDNGIPSGWTFWDVGADQARITSFEREAYRSWYETNRPTLPAPTTSYYIDFAGGDDTTGDGSSGNPWKTLNKVNANAAPGVHFFLSGNFDTAYTINDIFFQTDGTITSWLAFKQWAGMPQAVLRTGVYLRYADYCWVEGLTIDVTADGGGAAVWAYGTAALKTGMVVKDCVCDGDVEAVVDVRACSDAWVENVTTSATGSAAAYAGVYWGNYFNLVTGPDNIVVYNCLIGDALHSGMEAGTGTSSAWPTTVRVGFNRIVNREASCLGTGWMDGAIYEANDLGDAGQVDIVGASAQGIYAPPRNGTIRANRVWGSYEDGIRLQSDRNVEDQTTGLGSPVTDCLVQHNTVYKAGTFGLLWVTIGSILECPESGNVVRDNLFNESNWDGGYAAVSVSTLTHVTTTATCTTSSAHGLLSGHTTTIAGADQAPYNGNFVVTKVSDTIFTYTMLSDPGTNATGTITSTRLGNGTGGHETRIQVSLGSDAMKALWGVTSGGVTTDDDLTQLRYLNNVFGHTNAWSEGTDLMEWVPGAGYNGSTHGWTLAEAATQFGTNFSGNTEDDTPNLLSTTWTPGTPPDTLYSTFLRLPVGDANAAAGFDAPTVMASDAWDVPVASYAMGGSMGEVLQILRRVFNLDTTSTGTTTAASDAIWNADRASYNTAGTIGALMNRLALQFGQRGGATGATVTNDTAASVWNAPVGHYTTAGSLGAVIEVLRRTIVPPPGTSSGGSTDGKSDTVWNALTSAHTTSGRTGEVFHQLSRVLNQ